MFPLWYASATVGLLVLGVGCLGTLFMATKWALARV